MNTRKLPTIVEEDSDESIYEVDIARPPARPRRFYLKKMFTWMNKNVFVYSKAAFHIFYLACIIAVVTMMFKTLGGHVRSKPSNCTVPINQTVNETHLCNNATEVLEHVDRNLNGTANVTDILNTWDDSDNITSFDCGINLEFNNTILVPNETMPLVNDTLLKPGGDGGAVLEPNSSLKTNVTNRGEY